MSRSRTSNQARTTVWESEDLADHCQLIARQVQKSLEDPETRKLAVKIAGHRPDSYINENGVAVPIVEAWGLQLYLPPVGASPCAAQNDACEVQAVWNFLVANVRYVLDPDGYDLFCTLRRTLEAGAGDCFPVDTLVLYESGEMGPIGAVEVGDRIYDGERFVEVLKTWDRGHKTIHAMKLNNGSTLALSNNHKVARVPRKNPKSASSASGAYGSEERIAVADLRIGDDLLQPRHFTFGSQHLDPDDAFLVGMYLAEGCKTRKHASAEMGSYLSLSGVPGRKGGREELERILDTRGVAYQKRPRDISIKTSLIPILAEMYLGRTAIDKHLPHLDWDEETVGHILRGLELDSGLATNRKNRVFSSISRTLALQYRVLKRMQGFATGVTRLVDHGGAGNNSIYRVTVRVNDRFRPWARITGIEELPQTQPCVDIMTTSGKVYLPEADVITYQCDDATVAFASLLRALGFANVFARVVSTDGKRWAHVYPVVALPKSGSIRRIVPLDITVAGSVPGWQFKGISHQADYKL